MARGKKGRPFLVDELRPFDLAGHWERERDIESFISALESADREALRYFWRRRWKCEPPRLLITKLRRLIAFKFQSEEVGGRRDPSLFTAFADPLSRATVYMRTWQGVEHQVVETAQGLLYNGQHYRSLSAIARQITGTRWNGLVFFSAPHLKRRSARRSA